jgi:hypothetical protein
VGVSHRNDVRLDATSGTRAMHGGSEAGNGKATDDTDYSNVPGGPMPHTLRENRVYSYPSPTPLGRETRMVSTCRSIVRW